MMFLIRMAFWLGLVLALLPSFVTGPTSPPVAQNEFSPLEAASAASATVSDMRQFCARQPDACAVGSQALSTFTQRAQTGAQILFDFLRSKIRDHDGTAAPAARASQQTLMPGDQMLPWRGPVPTHKEARANGNV